MCAVYAEAFGATCPTKVRFISKRPLGRGVENSPGDLVSRPPRVEPPQVSWLAIGRGIKRCND
jgi:hypothetical protein